MAQLVYDIPDADLERCVAAYCASYGYQASLADGTPNSESAQAFARRMMSKEVINKVLGFEARAFAAAAATNPLPPITIS